MTTKVYSYREVVRIVKNNNFVFVRQSGSHEIYKRAEGGCGTIVLKHGSVNRMIWERIIKDNNLVL